MRFSKSVLLTTIVFVMEAQAQRHDSTPASAEFFLDGLRVVVTYPSLVIGKENEFTFTLTDESSGIAISGRKVLVSFTKVGEAGNDHSGGMSAHGGMMMEGAHHSQGADADSVHAHAQSASDSPETLDDGIHEARQRSEGLYFSRQRFESPGLYRITVLLQPVTDPADERPVRFNFTVEVKKSRGFIGNLMSHHRAGLGVVGVVASLGVMALMMGGRLFR